MFSFKLLWTSTESHKTTTQSYFVGSSSEEMVQQCTWFFHSSYFHHKGKVCKIGCKLAQIFLFWGHFLWYFADGDLINIRCRLLRGFRGLYFFSCFSLLQNCNTKAAQCVSEKQNEGISPEFLCWELHAFRSGSTVCRREENTTNCCFDWNSQVG